MRPTFIGPAIAAVLLIPAAWWAWTLTVSPELGSLADDSVSYLLMAQCWSPWEAASAVVEEACRHERYPPAFPFLLALTGASHDLALAHDAVLVLFLAAAWRYFRLAELRLDSTPLGVLALALFLVTPSTWINQFGILSESLYLLWTLLALERLERGLDRSLDRSQGWAAGLWLAVTLTGAALTRTVGITLIAAVILAALPRRSRHRWALAPGIVAGVLSLAWYLSHRPGGEVSYGHDVGGLFSALLDPETSWWAYLAPQVENLFASWISAFQLFWRPEGDLGFLWWSLLGVAALAYSLIRAIRNEPDGWYLLFYLGILVVWPYPGQIPRFLYPILPLLALAALSLFRMPPLSSHKQITGLVAVASLVICLPALSFLYYRAEIGRATPGYNLAYNPEFFRAISLQEAFTTAWQHEALLRDMGRIRRETPESAAVMWYTRGYIPLLAGRHGPSFPTDWKTPAELREAIRTSGADYLLLSRLHPRNTRSGANGLALLPLVLPYCDILWETTAPDQELVLSVMLRIDRGRIDTP